MATPRSTAPSIHDLDTPEGRQARAAEAVRAARRRKAAAGSVAALIVVAGAAAVAVHQQGVSSFQHAKASDSALAQPATTSTLRAGGPDQRQPAVTGSAKPAASGHVDVLVDGWSSKILAGRHLRYSLGGDSVPLQLEPATAADLAELMATTPDAVRQTMARLVTDDPTLTCSRSGCRTAHGDLSPNLLLRPARVPALGASYRGYGLTTGLYVGRIETGGSTGSVELTADGYQSLLVPALPVAATDDEGRTRAPVASNGYLRARFPVAAGLGRLFAPDARWLGTGQDPTRYAAGDATEPAAGAATTLAGQNPAVVTPAGLAAPFPAATSWTDSHLTYATAPSTGCGSEAVCAPVTLKVDTARDVRDVTAVCSPDGAHHGVAAMQDVVATVQLPAPTHQFGLGASDARWGKTPSLVTGRQQVRLAGVGLFDGSPLLSERLAGGRVDAGAPAAVAMASLLGGVRFDGAHWNAC